MRLKTAPARLQWKSPASLATAFAHRSAAASLIAFTMAIFLALVAGEAQARRGDALQGPAPVAPYETRAPVAIEASAGHAIVQASYPLQVQAGGAAGTDDPTPRSCGMSHAAGSGCSGATCASCFTAMAPPALALNAPGSVAGCRWRHLVSIAGPSRGSLFRPPRVDA